MVRKNLIIGIMLIIAGASFLISKISNSINMEIGFALKTFIPMNISLDYEDSHGGFHGDGESFAQGKLTDENVARILNHPGGKWKELPMEENLESFIYRYDQDKKEKISNFDDRIPFLSQGYYIFIDNYQGKFYSNQVKGSNMIHSPNFTLALIDGKKKYIYYYKFDS